MVFVSGRYGMDGTVVLKNVRPSIYDKWISLYYRTTTRWTRGEDRHAPQMIPSRRRSIRVMPRVCHAWHGAPDAQVVINPEEFR
jgi:hypothetical protein